MQGSWQDNWIRFKKKDKTTWPAEKQTCIIRLDIKNKATKQKRWKIIGNVWLNDSTKAFCYRDHNLTVSIPCGEDKTKIYYQVV